MNIINYIKNKVKPSKPLSASNPKEKNTKNTDTRISLAEGSELEGYKIGPVVGRGSFSLVYCAYDAHREKEIIIKEYFPKHIAVRREDGKIRIRKEKYAFAYTEGLKLFFHEALTLHKVTHPCVLQGDNIFRANKTAYLVANDQKGRDLQWFLRSVKEPMDLAFLYKVFMPVLSALACLHRINLLHLDIKPANILLQPNGESLLIDFGAAQNLSNRRRISKLQTLTHGFAPPEQYNKYKMLGPWTDIYAVGATMYYSIVCRLPKRSKQDGKVQKLSMAKYEKNYTATLIKAINKALSPKPEHRYDEIDAFAKQILDGSKWKSLQEYELDVMAYDRTKIKNKDENKKAPPAPEKLVAGSKP